MEPCERFLDLISQSLDGPLALEDQQALEQHLKQCPECRSLALELSQIHSELSSWEEQEVPEGFAAGVMDRIRAEEQTPKIVPIRKHTQFKMFGSIAACALICVGIWRMGVPHVAEDTAFSAAVTETAAETPHLYAVSAASAADDHEVYEAKAAQAPAAEYALPAGAGTPMQQSDLTAQFYIYSSDAEYTEQDLIQLVQQTLGEASGTLLVVEQIPDTLDGTWHTAEDGTILLVLDAQPEKEMWKTHAETAQFYVELGSGPIVLIQTN